MDSLLRKNGLRSVQEYSGASGVGLGIIVKINFLYLAPVDIQDWPSFRDISSALI